MHTWLKTYNLSNNHSFCYTLKINKTYISTSLKVVSIAKVFWESFSRVATRFRSLVIGTFDNNERHKKKRSRLLNIIQVGQKSQWLTRLSLSLGGSWGSVGELNVAGGGLGFSLAGWVSTLGAFFSSLTFWVGWGAAFSGVVSDGATWVASADLEMIAILLPGSTVSPSLARNCKQLNISQPKFNTSNNFYHSGVVGKE